MQKLYGGNNTKQTTSLFSLWFLVAEKKLVKALKAVKHLVNKNNIKYQVVLMIINSYDNNEQIISKMIVIIVMMIRS